MNRKLIRPVTIASICGAIPDKDALLRLVTQTAKQRPDLILLPEERSETAPVALDDPSIRRMQQIAREYGVYILHTAILANPGRGATNSALMIDRHGEIIGRYDKIRLYWNEHFLEPGALRQPVIDCDFGTVGVAICFDANFPEVWQSAAEQGAELMLFPSAYGAGAQLQAHALNHHYPIVSSTRSGHCMVYDIDGQRIANNHMDRKFGPYVQWVTLDLDRCIFHHNFNLNKLNDLLAQQPARIELEMLLSAEEWFVVRSAMEGVSARETCREAGMEELRAYKQRSREAIEALRS